MADELKFQYATSGLTIKAQLWSSADVGGLITLSEIPGTGKYYGSVPGGTPAGEYGVTFYSGSTMLGGGALAWNGTEEVTNLTLETDIAAVSGGGPGGETIISVTVPPDVAVASQIPSMLSIITWNTLRETLPDMGDLSTKTDLVFTLKNSEDDTDADALLQISEADGLIIANGAPAGDPSQGSLTVDDEAAGTVLLYVHEEITALLTPTNGVNDARKWDCKYKSASGWRPPISGDAIVMSGIGRVIS